MCQPSSVVLTDVEARSFLLCFYLVDSTEDSCGPQSLTEQAGIIRFESRATSTDVAQSLMYTGSLR